VNVGPTGVSGNTNGDVWGIKVDLDASTLSVNINGGAFSTPIDIPSVSKPWFFAGRGYFQWLWISDDPHLRGTPYTN
jgi:hypothetical protein